MAKSTSTTPAVTPPILFLIFNRPDTTALVFDAIRKARPQHLYVAADGPRSTQLDDIKKTNQAREIATNIDWPCELKTLFRDFNLGGKTAVSEAITWFFHHESQGIILEDDCLPNPDFFHFCTTLLHYYANDSRVSVITGNNFQNGIIRGNSSYYFSKYNHCWGWATWRRAWNNYQDTIPFWPIWCRSQDWKLKIPDPIERRYWKNIFSQIHSKKITHWDYQWTACIWNKGGLTATPNVNLVSNIGFGPNASNTKATNSPLAALDTEKLGPISHPSTIRINSAADRYAFDHVFFGKFMRFPYSLLRLPKYLAKKIYAHNKK